MRQVKTPPAARRMPEVRLGACRVQTGEARFGPLTATIIKQRDECAVRASSFEDNPMLVSNYQAIAAEIDKYKRLHKAIPSMQYHRNNLTALSQKYNLYFAGYGSKIHVYRPRNIISHSLPTDADLILEQKMSTVARHIGGHVDSGDPYLINHLITGCLGHEEIVLACYDNGDVVAYYTKEVADHVAATFSARKPPVDPPPPVLKPFLHENVGKSAWGLAVHARSRLIAVSSNLHEVTIFALGLSQTPQQAPGGSAERGGAGSQQAVDYVHKSVLKRKRNWRILIIFGSECNNIPNVAFMDDKDGFAEKIVAQDISGPCWVADIWKSCTRPIKLPHHASVSGRRGPLQLGWGVLTIPESCFMYVDQWEDLLGLKKDGITLVKKANLGKWINATASLDSVRDNPSLPRGQPRNQARSQTPGQQAVANNPFAQALLSGDDVDESEAEEADDQQLENLINMIMADGDATAAVGTIGTLQQPMQLPIFAGGFDDDEDDDDDDDSEMMFFQQGFGVGNGIIVQATEDGGAASSGEDDGQEGDDEAEEGHMEQVVLPNEVEENDEEGDGHSDEDDNDSILAEAGGVAPLDLFSMPAGAFTLPQVVVPPGLQAEPAGAIYNFPQSVGWNPPLQAEPAGAIYNNPQSMGWNPPLQAEPAGAIFNPPQAVGWNPPPPPPPQSQHIFGWVSLMQVKPPEGIVSLSAAQTSWMDMIFTPFNGKTYAAPVGVRPTLRFLRHSRNMLPGRLEEQDAEGIADLTRRYSVLRGYEKDLELRSLAWTETGAVCLDPTELNRWPRHPLHKWTARLSMMALVPELSLAVAASLNGRVVLLTLTRMRPSAPLTIHGPREQHGIRRGFRVDWILPTKRDEEAKRRPDMPLFGMAIGPVQEKVVGATADGRGRGRRMGDGGGGGGRGGEGHGDSLLLRQEGRPTGPSPRFRLILHYRDHSILSYELSRDHVTGALNVI